MKDAVRTIEVQTITLCAYRTTDRLHGAAQHVASRFADVMAHEDTLNTSQSTEAVRMAK